jgi:hypothetical protein
MAADLFTRLPTPKTIVLSEARPDPALENPGLNLSGTQPKRGSFPIWVTGTGAVIFAGGAAGLLAMSLTARSCLHGPAVEGSPTVCVPRNQVPVVQRRADIGLVTGTAAGAIALGLAVTAIVQYAASN